MLGMFDIKLGTFVALGVRGSGMIENCSFNLGEFYVKMNKTNRNFLDDGGCVWNIRAQLE